MIEYTKKINFKGCNDPIKLTDDIIESIFPQLVIIDKRLAKSLINRIEKRNIFEKRLRFIKKYPDKTVDEKLNCLLEVVDLINAKKNKKTEQEKDYLKLADKEFKKGNYNEMLFWLQIAAEKGNATAIHLLYQLKI